MKDTRQIRIKNEHIQKLSDGEAGLCFIWLNGLVQHHGFSGNREDAVKALKERSGLSEKKINGYLDYLYSLDIEMDELIRE